MMEHRLRIRNQQARDKVVDAAYEYVNDLCTTARYINLERAIKELDTVELPEDKLMIEGIASQMRKSDAPTLFLGWWHLISEDERERYRAKARNHIAQLGWK